MTSAGAPSTVARHFGAYAFLTRTTAGAGASTRIRADCSPSHWKTAVPPRTDPDGVPGCGSASTTICCWGWNPVASTERRADAGEVVTDQDVRTDAPSDGSGRRYRTHRPSVATGTSPATAGRSEAGWIRYAT